MGPELLELSTITDPIMKTNSFIASIAFMLAACPVAGAMSILEVKDNLHETPVILPESFETDVHKMQHNWYLNNYADIDRSADSKATVNVTDEEIIDRLSKLPTTIEMPFNSVVKNYIMMYVDRRKQLVENMLGMSLYYMPIFEQALDRYNLPLELKYLPVIESALNPEAVSRVGATGLWQFMLPTAKGEGLEVSTLVDERRDPYASSDAAARYLKKLYDIYGDWSLAIASYNCGPGNVNKAIRRAGGGKKDFWQIYPHLPAETRGYVPAFIAANYVMTYYGKHNISPALARKPILTDTVHVSRRVHFEQIRDVLGIPLEEISSFNPQYRTGLIPGDIKPYSLVLPSLQVYSYLAYEDSIVNHNADKYARRDIVEPASAGSGSDSKGEYVEELVVKYHTVRKGETLSSIARKYGVTASSIRKTNKCGKRVRRGQKLRINTIKRRYLPTPVEQPVMNVAVNDSLTMPRPEMADTIQVIEVKNVQVVDSVSTDTAATAAPAKNEKAASRQNTEVSQAMANSSARKIEKPAPKKQKQNKESARQTQPKSRSHTVRKGENLSKIASNYGVSVDALRRANGIKGDAIRAGQKLTIPSKGNSKSSKKGRRRR